MAGGGAGMGLKEEPNPREGGRGPENDWLEEEQESEESGDVARGRGTWPETWVQGGRFGVQEQCCGRVWCPGERKSGDAGSPEQK